MVESHEQLDATLKALSDSARREILAALRSGPKTVGQLAAPLDMTLAGASKHIGVLERARLIRREKRGRERVCSLSPEPMQALERWLSDYAMYWDRRLDALEDALRLAHDDER